MRTAFDLASTEDYHLFGVTCRDDHTDWSTPEVRSDYRVVLVRSGRFRRTADGQTSTVDKTLAYVGAPGQEERFAHPCGGDVCTTLSVTPALWAGMAGDRVPAPTLYVDAGIDLAHRRLLACADHDRAEHLVRLLGAAVDQVVTATTPSASSRADGAMVAEARDAILGSHPASTGLIPLARWLDVSPYRLSRAFTREVGVSVTRYRNRVRVGAAMDRLTDGDQVATIAADLGFADQAHLTRTMRAHVGHTPSALRAMMR